NEQSPTAARSRSPSRSIRHRPAVVEEAAGGCHRVVARRGSFEASHAQGSSHRPRQRWNLLSVLGQVRRETPWRYALHAAKPGSHLAGPICGGATLGTRSWSIEVGTIEPGR